MPMTVATHTSSCAAIARFARSRILRSSGTYLCYSGVSAGPRRFADQLLDPDRQPANAHAGGVIDGVRYGRSHAGQANLADAARSVLVDVQIGILDEDAVEIRGVSVRRNQVVGIVVVQRFAVAAVVVGLLEQAHADTHYNGADDLVLP